MFSRRLCTVSLVEVHLLLRLRQHAAPPLPETDARPVRLPTQGDLGMSLQTLRRLC